MPERSVRLRERRSGVSHLESYETSRGRRDIEGGVFGRLLQRERKAHKLAASLQLHHYGIADPQVLEEGTQIAEPAAPARD